MAKWISCENSNRLDWRQQEGLQTLCFLANRHQSWIHRPTKPIADISCHLLEQIVDLLRLAMPITNAECAFIRIKLGL